MIYGNVYCEDFSNNALFDKESLRNSDGLFDAIILLREELLRRGIEVNTPDLNGTRSIAFELHLDGRTLATGMLPKYLIAMENPYINKLNSDPKYLQLFRMVFTWNDAARSHCRASRIMLPNNISAPTSRSFEERPIFACLISENKMPPDSRANDLYAKRLEVIRWYEKNAPDKFELYGRGWRKPSPAFNARERFNRRIGRLRTQLFGHKPFPSWKGEVDRKSKVLVSSKFSYCFENVKDLPNYITEKIFDCFRSGCVPIYWGANNVLEYIPKSCFIDRRDFENTEEVHHYLLTIGTQEFEQYQQSIAAFMSSASAQQFSNEQFASEIASQIADDLLNLSGT